MSLAHDHENTVPRPALIMAFALVGFVLLLTATVSLGFAEREAVPSAVRAAADVAPVERRRLAFADSETGAVIVSDATSGATITRFGRDSEGGGFVRGVMRGLARERMMNGIGASPPFELTLWEDGSLSLEDTATGRMIELGSFGHTNRATFARFLERSAA